MRVGYGTIIARISNRGGPPACSHAARLGVKPPEVSMSLMAKRQVTGMKLAANRCNGARWRGPVTPRARAHSAAGQGPVMQEWPTKRTVGESPGGTGAKIKNVVTKATKYMKTLGKWTKCRDEKAKIRRKSGLFFGHLRQSEVDSARNCRCHSHAMASRGLQAQLR